MNWRLSVWLSETFRNTCSHAATSITIVVMSALAVGAIATTELREATTALERRQTLDYAGANVLIVEASNQTDANIGGITTGRCAALNDVTGVSRAATETLGAPTNLPAYPGSPITPVAITGSLPNILDPDLIGAASGGAWISQALHEQLGPGVGAPLRLSTATEPLTVAGIVRPSRAPETGARIYYPADPTRPSGRCWVELSGPLTQPKLNAISAWFANDSPISTRALLSADQLAIDPQQQFLNRPTRYAWIAVGSLLGAVWALLARARRPEVALLMSIGANRLVVVTSLATEIAVTAIVGATAGVAFSAIYWHLTTDAPARTSSILFAGFAPAVLAVSLGLSMANIAIYLSTHGSQLQALKNRE